MSPIEAVQREVSAELDALGRRLGTSAMPDAVTIRVEIDRQTGMPRTVDCQEERSRRILGGTVARDPKRCGAAA